MTADEDELDDWEELMPNHDEERLSFVYDVFDTAMYADHEDFSVREGLYGSFLLLFVPSIVGIFLMFTIQIASGDVTVAEVITALETARAEQSESASGSLLSAINWMVFAQQMLLAGIQIPICIGVTLAVKTLFKAIANLRS